MSAIPSNTNQVNHRRLTIDVKGKGQHGTLNDMVIPNSDFAVGKNIFEFSLPEGVNYIDVDRFYFIPNDISLSFAFKKFKLVHVNSRGKSVVLIDVINNSDTEIPRFDEGLILGLISTGFNGLFPTGFNLGFFRINRGDRIFIEIDFLRSVNGKDVVFSLLSCCDTSLVPHYDLHRFYFLSKGEKYTLKRKDFDSVISDGFPPLVNGFNPALSFLNENIRISNILNSYVYLSCGNDSFVFEGTRDDADTVFLTKKQVHNADTFHLMQEYVKRVKNVLMEKSTTDYSNTIFKQLYGKMPTLDKLNSVIELYSQLNLNDRNFGHEDFYEIPEYVEPNNLIS
ncbi:hypothetical protein [Capnocytophaga canimorsus]|uniref:hypothetical protein n=1 Tax=Capnocytophaga canimorsus TaxID=28188 RepID=UPI0037D38855